MYDPIRLHTNIILLSNTNKNNPSNRKQPYAIFGNKPVIHVSAALNINTTRDDAITTILSNTAATTSTGLSSVRGENPVTTRAKFLWRSRREAGRPSFSTARCPPATGDENWARGVTGFSPPPYTSIYLSPG